MPISAFPAFECSNFSAAIPSHPMIVPVIKDFMFRQYDNVAALRTNATFADDWLLQMADNAAKCKDADTV